MTKTISIQTLARLSFAATLILIPFRLRVVLLSRPIESIYRDYLDFILFASDLFLIITLLLWLINLVTNKRQVILGPFFLSIPLGALTLFAILSSIFSLDPALSIYHSVRLILLGLLYLFIVNELSSLKWVAIPVAIQAAIQAVVGIAQILEQHSLGLVGLQELELDPAWSGVSIIWAVGIRSLRAYGLTDHPNILGGSLAFALLILATWYIESKTERRPLIAAIFALVSLVLFLTFSRAAWLAFAGGSLLMIVLFWLSHSRDALRDLAMLGAATTLFLLPFLWHNSTFLVVRMNPTDAANGAAIEDRSIAERNALAEAANRIFADHPLLGIGVGAFPQAVRLLYPRFEFFYQPAHIALLDAAAETGIFGALIYFVLIVAPWAALWLKRTRLIFSTRLIGVSAALLAVTAIGFFDYYTWLLAPGRLWQWTLWGLWAAAYRDSHRSNS